jgi:ABC-type multidrug transport system fused ATPase/permease subunit
MVLGYDYPLGGLLWTMFVFFMWIIWFWLLISVFSDLFRDKETSGGMKAVWCIFVIIAPFLGVFVYLLARGGGMAERSMAQQQAAQAQMDAYVRETAGSSGAAGEIAHAKELLDSGAISQEEYEALKAKALA